MYIAVCDDEVQIRDCIERYIRILYSDAVIEFFENGQKLLNSSNMYNILFLDINMPDVDGIKVAKELRERGCDSIIIFVTGLKEYVFDAFDVKAFHYLVKPFDRTKFFDVLNKAAEDIKERQNTKLPEEVSIIVKSGAVTHKIYASEIYYLEIYNRKITIYMRDGAVDFYGKMADLEQKLGEDFARCHRSYLVNLRFVKKYTSVNITMENGSSVLMAKQKYPEFVKRYMEYVLRERERNSKGYV